METDRYTNDAIEYMNILLEAGFNTQVALERTLEYLLSPSPTSHLNAAKSVRKAAIHLGVDYKSQRIAMRQSQGV